MVVRNNIWVYIIYIYIISIQGNVLRKARKRGYVPRIDRATPCEFYKGGVKPGSQYVAQQCGAARCGVTQAPRRAFNCASVFTILIKSARPHPLHPCSNRLYWPSCVRRVVPRREDRTWIYPSSAARFVGA